MSRAWRGKRPGNKINPLPKVQQKCLIYLGGGTSSWGESLAGGTGALPVGSFGTWAGAGTKPRLGCGVGAGLKEVSGSVSRTLGPRNMRTSTPGSRGGTLQCGRVLGAVSFSLHPEPYVRAFLGKQEVEFAKFSTESSAGPIPAHPAWPEPQHSASSLLQRPWVSPLALSPPFLPSVSPSKLP